MSGNVHEIQGTRVLICSAENLYLGSVSDGDDLIGAAWSEDVSIVSIPADRVGKDFFRLRSGLAGAVAQKFVNYNLCLALIGDVSHWAAQSEPLRDFMRESNAGRSLWFLADDAALETRLRS